MKKAGILQSVVLLVTFIAGVASWSQREAGMVPVSMIVSVEAKHGKEVPTVYKEDVRVMHDRDRLQVTDWSPCQSKEVGLELFLLVDDAISAEIGLQFNDLKNFIQGQPSTTAIGVGYARNGVAEVSQNLSNEHTQVAKALRLPIGLGATASPYLAVTDLIKRWPQGTGCREILLISSGIDFLQGGPQDSYLQEAIDQAQRSAIQVYAIYAQPPGHAAHSFWLINWGQNNLSQLTEETGGEFYIQGLATPIAFAPYLGEFAARFTHQYRLTFLAKPAEKGRFQHIRLETEVTNAELVGQSNVYVPGTK
jgi:hypothetical protein